MSNEEQGQEQPKTKQRLMYEDATGQMTQRLELIHGMAEQLVKRAAEIGVVLTIDTVPIPRQIPAMGQCGYRIEARAGREVYKFLDTLEQAAIASEQEQEQEQQESSDVGHERGAENAGSDIPADQGGPVAEAGTTGTAPAAEQ